MTQEQQIFERGEFRAFLQKRPVEATSIEVNGKPVGIGRGFQYMVFCRKGDEFLYKSGFFVSEETDAEGETEEFKQRILSHRNLLISHSIKNGRIEKDLFTEEELKW